jgi:hypothetical protein
MLLRAPPLPACRAAAAAAVPPRGRAAAPLRAAAPRPQARRGRSLALASLGAGDDASGARRQRGPSPPRVAGTAEPSAAPAPPTVVGGAAVAVENAINKALVDSVVRPPRAQAHTLPCPHSHFYAFLLFFSPAAHRCAVLTPRRAWVAGFPGG